MGFTEIVLVFLLFVFIVSMVIYGLILLGIINVKDYVKYSLYNNNCDKQDTITGVETSIANIIPPPTIPPTVAPPPTVTSSVTTTPEVKQYNSPSNTFTSSSSGDMFCKNVGKTCLYGKNDSTGTDIKCSDMYENGTFSFQCTS